MARILEELYYGKIQPDVKHHGPDSPYWQVLRLKEKNLDKLMAVLDPAEKELLDKYCGAQEDIESIIRYDLFTYALKFGVLLMTEVFMGKGDIISTEGEGNV